jgi:hypothetical protein
MEEAGRQCTYLLGPAYEASPALIAAVSYQTPPRADIARKHDSQGMRSPRTFISQLPDSPMQVPMAFPHGCGDLGLCFGNTVPQASDSSSGMCSMKSVATSLLTISGHLDGIQFICPHHTTIVSAFGEPAVRIRSGSNSAQRFRQESHCLF